jgi:hypothetical protein
MGLHPDRCQSDTTNQNENDLRFHGHHCAAFLPARSIGST